LILIATVRGMDTARTTGTLEAGGAHLEGGLGGDLVGLEAGEELLPLPPWQEGVDEVKPPLGQTGIQWLYKG